MTATAAVWETVSFRWLYIQTHTHTHIYGSSGSHIYMCVCVCVLQALRGNHSIVAVEKKEVWRSVLVEMAVYSEMYNIYLFVWFTGT